MKLKLWIILLFPTLCYSGSNSFILGILKALRLPHFSQNVNLTHFEENAASENSPLFNENPTYYPQVNTSSGLVIGATWPESHAFYSIPYGEPPIGNLRFQPPVAAEYNGKLNKSFPNFVACFEGTIELSKNKDIVQKHTEDCLVLTVYVPAHVDLLAPPNVKLPVMVWLHGGAFFIGAGTDPRYSGRWLSNSTNTVVVSVNYRLDALGFLVYEENGISFDGNQGFKDQQLALMWIQKNIENFGGDKNRVTIFSQSAGAQSAMLHLISKRSDPLFHRVIMESNPAAYYYPTKEEAKQRTHALLLALGCFENKIQCLRKVSATKLSNAHATTMLFKPFNIFNIVEPFRPVLDDDEFIQHPFNYFHDGKWQTHKEVTIGTNSEELSCISYLFKDIIKGKLSFYGINELVFGGKFGPLISEEYVKLATGGRPYADILAQQMADMMFVCPTRALARMMSTTSSVHPPNVFMYSNSHPGNGPNCKSIGGLCGHAYHSSETYYVFNSWRYTKMNFTRNDRIVAKMFSDYWGHFSYFGKPTFDLRTWPSYMKRSLPWKEIGPWINAEIHAPNLATKSLYREDLCDFWDSIGYYGNGTTYNITSI